jgi:uncharacterized protein (TIGR02996 family)
VRGEDEVDLSRNLELEDAIVERPDDDARYAVYGDWLEQQGDPRGALMVAEANLRAEERRRGARIVALRRAVETLWRERGDAVAGELNGLRQHGLALDWRMGCVHGAELVVPADDSGAATMAHLLAHPASFAIRRVSVRTESLGEHGFSYQPIVDLVAETCPRTLRDLGLGELDGWTEDETVVLGDLRPLFARHAQLRRLTLAGRASTVSAPWALPELRELSLRPVGLSRTWLRVVTAEPWPALRRLAFSYVSALDTDIGWLSSSRLSQRFPRLQRLALHGTDEAGLVVEMLAATGVSLQLRELDLSWTAFGAQAARQLEEEREDFPRLATLVVERGHKRVEQLREMLPWLEVSAR